MPKTILIVDDSATVRQLIELNLRKLPDVKIVQAVDGVDALLKIKDLSPVVILTDVNMPNMNGLELLEAIRTKNGDKTTPIVVITTKGEKDDAEKAMALGATAYVTKPINGPQLIDTVRMLLK